MPAMNRAGPLLLILAALVGCDASRGGKAAGPTDPQWTESPFVPVGITVHPLTRLVSQAEGQWTIDAHIEFRDAAGDEVKATGRLVLELYREMGAVMEKSGRQRILQWATDLSDLRENSRAFDRVTRTYRFELSGIPETAGPSGGLRLRALLERRDGLRLTDEKPIPR